MKKLNWPHQDTLSLCRQLMIPDSMKVPKKWALRSQETLKMRIDGQDGGCVPGEDGWELCPK